ncbi:type II toxin-antitoxin system PemK/MazF family toxin [Maribrevibacterium harenarium]|uniref:Type II toxin-antitoxin system PemK/MazF family toxin n=1 Tax=Maribrevibacterium harenarium TaxID=2589817 RepID=A0A501WYI2_9GAMM|nr:type II toxin-antitoxin system PemK/MazF family toxin [Maribrevibacterium harenarium]TPE53335.1 type II toxin-antitoxin system PemK/MazF family toxin [Maribrevibacterium harenarium]
MSINLGDNSKVKLRALCNSYCVRILFDQIRTIDKKRRKGKLGEVESSYWQGALLQMFV